jgi:tyrosine-protein kinase Etk/Wzc
MMAGYAEDPNGAADEPRELDNELTLKSVWLAVRRRWWIVALVFISITALGVWRTKNERDQYRASATVRVPQQQAPIQGMQMGPLIDYRIDRLVAEMVVIRSAAVAEGAARRVGLQLRVAEPEGLQRSYITGVPPVVDSTAMIGDYRLTLSDQTYSLSSGATLLGTASYGDTLRISGISLVLPSRPGLGTTEVILEVVPLAAAAGVVTGSVETAVRDKTDIIAISVTLPDRLLAMQTANAVAESYAEYARQGMLNQAEAKTRFISQQLERQARELAVAQDSLKRFREANQLTDVSAEVMALQSRIAALESEREQYQLERDNYHALVGEISATDTTTEKLRRIVNTGAVAANTSVKALYDKWFELSSTRQEMIASNASPASNEVLGIDSQIASTKADLHLAANDYLRTLGSHLNSIDARLETLRRETGRYPALAADEERLQAAQRSLQAVYENLQGQYQLAQIAQAVDAEVVQPIDQATLPLRPISPDRRRDSLLAAALGILLGVAVAVLLDRLDDSVRSPDEIAEQLNLPVMGMIPAIHVVDDPKFQGSTIMERLVTHANPRSPVAEAYRSLRTNLAFARARESIKTMVLTSPGPADGKSTTVANLAITFAQQGQRTLLIDADLRRAVLDKTFSVPRSPGLTEVIVGEADLEHAVSKTEVPNLFVLGSGQFPPNPSELLGSTAMRKVLAEARDQFDVVLFDSPPLLAVTDAAVLATMVDGTVIVIRMGATARQAVRRALAQLHAVHGRVLGAVMNDVDLRKSSYYGGYGYAYYAYYGNEANGNGRRQGVLGRLREIAGVGRHGGGPEQ